MVKFIMNIVVDEKGGVSVYEMVGDPDGKPNPKANFELLRTARKSMEQHFRKLGLMVPEIIVPNGIDMNKLKNIRAHGG